jgi:hypothetical protein
VDTGPTPTPLPTSSVEGFPTVADQSCLITELRPLRTNQPQGDLLAWRPESNQLAYVGPAGSSNWYAGSLMLASGPDFNKPVSLSPDKNIFGDLTWSQDGSLLAYASLRFSDGVYTISTSTAEGGAPQDWLPGEAARTEQGTSSKAVIGWLAGRRLRVLSACGPDCDEILEINLNTGEVGMIGEQTRLTKDRLALRTHLATYDEKAYPYMIQPNWTPDEKKVAYIDEDDRVYVLQVGGKVQYILDIGVNIPRETKWAPDNHTLAVRTDDFIFVFDTECKKP